VAIKIEYRPAIKVVWFGYTSFTFPNERVGAYSLPMVISSRLQVGGGGAHNI
jgi:hypothetical protein